MLDIKELENRVQKVLEKVRPYLKIDGGDVELIKVREDGIVELRFLGACDTCALKPMTLRAGVERSIMHEISEIKRIECLS